MHRIVILVAGKGTRMNSELPKALVPVNGKPMIEWLLRSVIKSKIDSCPIVVVSPDNKGLIESALMGHDLSYVVQEKQLGTGHAVSCARTSIDLGDDVIVLYCDHPFISADSIKNLSEIEGKSVSLMPTDVGDFEAWHRNFYHWGRIIRSNGGEIERIVEYKDATEVERKVTEVNPGIMKFSGSWLWANVDNLTDSNSQHEYYLTDLVKLAFGQEQEIGSIGIDPLEAIGINSQEELKIAEDILKGMSV